MSRSHTRRVPVLALVLAVSAALAVGGCGSSGSGGTGGGSPKTTASRTASGAPKPSAPASTVLASPAWVPSSTALADVCRSKLPSQALDTLGLIAKGGPYPYRSDGIVFENRESRLPRQKTGYYHEYTVVTPGSDDRGTRRIVTGTAGEQYWTGDHYASFQEIDARC